MRQALVKGKRFIRMSAIREDGERMSQSPSSCLGADRGFRVEGEGKQNREIKGWGWKVLCVQTSAVHSGKDLETGQGMVWCVPSGF